MDAIIAVAIVVISIATEGLIVNQARQRAADEDKVTARLAHFAGR